MTQLSNLAMSGDLKFKNCSFLTPESHKAVLEDAEEPSVVSWLLPAL